MRNGNLVVEKRRIQQRRIRTAVDYSDDSYIIIHNSDGDHEHILSHRVLPAVEVPDFVRETLEEGLSLQDGKR